VLGLLVRRARPPCRLLVLVLVLVLVLRGDAAVAEGVSLALIHSRKSPKVEEGKSVVVLLLAGTGAHTQ
jgi:hypothetical protein